MIAIKDMKMPKSCVECKLCEYNEHIGYYCVANNGGKFTMTREEMKEKRLDDCPLVEIVTCKDCKYCEEVHYEDEGEPPYVKLKCNSTRNTRFYRIEEDFFCKDGKRRE